MCVCVCVYVAFFAGFSWLVHVLSVCFSETLRLGEDKRNKLAVHNTIPTQLTSTSQRSTHLARGLAS